MEDDLKILKVEYLSNYCMDCDLWVIRGEIEENQRKSRVWLCSAQLVCSYFCHSLCESITVVNDSFIKLALELSILWLIDCKWYLAELFNLSGPIIYLVRVIMCSCWYLKYEGNVCRLSCSKYIVSRILAMKFLVRNISKEYITNTLRGWSTLNCQSWPTIILIFFCEPFINIFYWTSGVT